MKIINKKIRALIIEIVIVVVLAIGSVPLWNSFEANEYAAIAASYANMAYFDIAVDDSFANMTLIPLSDVEALTLDTFEVKIKNFKMKNNYYEMAFKISKDSTMDYKFLKMNINGYIGSLTDLSMMEDNNYYYFIFDKGFLEETVKTYQIRMYLSETIELMKNDTINISIVLM